MLFTVSLFLVPMAIAIPSLEKRDDALSSIEIKERYEIIRSGNIGPDEIQMINTMESFELKIVYGSKQLTDKTGPIRTIQFYNESGGAEEYMHFQENSKSVVTCTVGRIVSGGCYYSRGPVAVTNATRTWILGMDSTKFTMTFQGTTLANYPRGQLMAMRCRYDAVTPRTMKFINFDDFQGTYALTMSLAPCNAGSYMTKEGCSQCLGGTWSAANAKTCSQCPAGTWSADNAHACTVCPNNKTSAIGSTSAESCFYAPCNAGSYMTKEGCSQCLGGTWSADNAKICSKCTSGTWSAANAKTCSKCPFGTWSGENASACTNCTAGKIGYPCIEFHITKTGDIGSDEIQLINTMTTLMVELVYETDQLTDKIGPIRTVQFYNEAGGQEEYMHFQENSKIVELFRIGRNVGCYLSNTDVEIVTAATRTWQLGMDSTHFVMSLQDAVFADMPRGQLAENSCRYDAVMPTTMKFLNFAGFQGKYNLTMMFNQAPCNVGSEMTMTGCSQCPAGYFSAVSKFACTVCPTGYTAAIGSTIRSCFL